MEHLTNFNRNKEKQKMIRKLTADPKVKKNQSREEQLKELRAKRTLLFNNGFHHRVITLDMQIARIERELNPPKKKLFS